MHIRLRPVLTAVGLAWLAVMCLAGAATAREHVTLQLKWRHQFQFAGYYAALEKGYFEQEDLWLTLREGQPGQSPTAALLNDEADFAVTGPSVLVERTQGKPLVVAGSIFQHSPLVLATLKTSGLETVHDLIGRRVMADSPGEPGQADIWAMFAREGVAPIRVVQVPHSWSVSDLLEGRVDAMSLYSTNELIALERRGVAVNVIRPTAYGVDFYGDVLVTTDSFARYNRPVVEGFLRAVRRGWIYAMQHPDEIIDVILKHHAPHADRRQLQREAAAMQSIVLAESVEIGHSNAGRWQAIAETYQQQGLIADPQVPDGLLLDDFYHSHQASQERWRDVALTLAGIGVCAALLTAMANSGLRAVVRQRTRALSESEERFRTQANSMPLLIWLSGMDRGCTWFNAGWLAFTGRSLDQELGTGWVDGVHPDDLDRCLEIYLTHFDRQQAFRMEYRLRRHDGEYRWILDSGAPRFADDGTFAGFSGACLDISDRKAAEAALQDSRADLARSNDALQQFAYAASHDLQEPLRMISSYLQLLDRRYGGQLDADGREFLGFAVDGAQRMQALIVELLDFSRLGTRPVEKIAVSMDECANRAITNLRVAIEECAAVVHIHPLPMVHGNAGQLTRLMQNLLSNAIKYRAPGAVPHITVDGAVIDGGLVEIRVTDDGIGIDPAAQDRVFALFARLHGPADYPGTGMGLALCRKITDLHGGVIGVESGGAGQGSCFCVTLPGARDDPPDL